MPVPANRTSSRDELQQQVAQLQLQLDQSEARLQSFLSLTHEAFCCLEFDPPIPTQLTIKEQSAMVLSARVVDCNAAMLKLYGVVSSDEFLGSRFVSLVNTPDESLVQRARRFIRSGYHVEGVHNIETLQDGTERHLLNSSRGEFHEGHLVRVWVTSRDVTYQALIEAASQHGDSELCSAAEKLDSAFWLMDWNRFEMLYSGPATEERWGVSRERLLQDPLCWMDRVHDHDRVRVRDAFLTHAATGSYDETFRIRLPDGSVGWIRDRCFALPDSTSDRLLVVGLAQDISELHRTRTELSSLYRLTSEMLFVLDVHGGLVEANPVMARALGYDAEKLCGMSLFDLLRADEQTSGRQLLSRLVSGRSAVEIQSRFLRADGSECPVEWNAAPAGDDGRIYAAGRDISNELAEADRNARQNQARTQLDRLSPRERQILDLVVAGKANKVIARELDLSKRTVETHRANLIKKLNLTSTAALIRLALQAAD